jgi:hypothetical protein
MNARTLLEILPDFSRSSCDTTSLKGVVSIDGLASGVEVGRDSVFRDGAKPDLDKFSAIDQARRELMLLERIRRRKLVDAMNLETKMQSDSICSAIEEAVSGVLLPFVSMQAVNEIRTRFLEFVLSNFGEAADNFLVSGQDNEIEELSKCLTRGNAVVHRDSNVSSKNIRIKRSDTEVTIDYSEIGSELELQLKEAIRGEPRRT